MSAKLACVGAIVLGAALGSCLPSSKSDDASKKAQQPSVDLAADAPLKIAIVQFPNAYFGRWGLTPGDCKNGVSDAKGLISVQGSLVKFYEATATMRDGQRETMTSMSANFEFVGEGQKWEKKVRYQLRDDRQVLIRTDLDDGVSYTYQRCQG
jgi:hypothetical protein